MESLIPSNRRPEHKRLLNQLHPAAVRTALQDVLKEKQQHIEQLLKERDLERAEITKAASLADEAEQRYVSIQKEFENYRLDCDRKLKEYVFKLTEFENEKKELLGQLDEERGKNEDWQFKFEEAAIIKSDAEHRINAQNSTNEEHVAKIAELNLQLSLLRSELEVDAGKLSQANETINTLKEANEAAKVELEHAIEKRSSLESEETKSIELVQTLQSQVEEANTTLKQHQELSAKQMDDLNKQLVRLNSEHEVETFKQNQEIEELRAKYTNDINAKNDELKLLAINFEEVKIHLKMFRKSMKNTNMKLELLSTMKKELDKIKMEMSAKVLELENQHETSKTQTDDMKKLEEALAQTQAALESQIRETENVNMEEEKSMIEVEKLKEMLEQSNGTINQLKTEVEQKVEDSRKELETSNMKINEMTEQMNALKSELTSKIDLFKELQSKYENSEEELAKTCQKLEKEKTEFAQVQERLNLELKNLEQLKNKDSQLELQLGDSQRCVAQLEEKMAEALVNKNKMEAEIQQLLGASGEESSKLEILNKELQAKQTELESNKNQFEAKIKELEHSLQEVKINFTNMEEKSKIEKGDLEQMNAALKQTIEELNNASGKSQDSLNKTLSEVRDELKAVKLDVADKDAALEKLKQELGNEVQIKSNLESKFEESTKHTQELQVKLEEALKEIAALNESVQSANEQLQLAHKDVQQRATDNDDLVTKMKASFQEQIDVLNASVTEKDVTIQELLANIEEIEKQNSQKDANATEKDLEIETMLKNHLEVKKHSEELRLDVENTKQQLENAQAEILKLNERMHEMTAKITEKDHELQEAHKGETVILEKNNKITALDTKLIEVNKTLESISAQLETSKTNELQLQNQLEIKIQECQKLQNDVEISATKEDEINKLKNEMQIMQKSMSETEVLNNELREKLGKMVDAETINIGEMKQLTDRFNLCLKLFTVLKVTDEHKQQLLASQDIKGSEILVDLVTKLPVQVINDNKDKLQQLEQMINTSNESLQAANDKIKHHQNEMLLMQQEVLKARLEAERKVTTVKISDETINNNNTGKSNSNDYKQLLEEKLEAETQVEFLHSIIADMQKKNEEQKARIEILESGYSPAAADELKLIGLIDKTVTPRMYCDICEEFDLHETEDCPTQADDDMPAPPPPDGKKKEIPPPRPYCEICEAFGHATDDCTEDETY
ncbi:LOW QUALITY PROTEIN: CAP-Gly domain-containing linker protein 1-like [Atheta coriaria]|uniref:LOW QUALITY PROTEIN: CAP-Gly domain-containing linker protein 1-like n=1 Tax=Dalotia coriaria TaxID=877792 RepID=UPI0031F407DC